MAIISNVGATGPNALAFCHATSAKVCVSSLNCATKLRSGTCAVSDVLSRQRLSHTNSHPIPPRTSCKRIKQLLITEQASVVGCWRKRYACAHSDFTAVYSLFLTMWNKQYGRRVRRHGMPPPVSNPDLWPFDLETGVPVASKVRNLHSKFGRATPLGSRIIRYVRDGQTDRLKQRLLPPSLWSGT